jgi:predicted pyridoxine 5'-phosphate oxidase superfamily flavin-nucleotide-binding protein
MVNIPKELISLFEGKTVYFATASKTGVPNLVCVVPNKVEGGRVIITDNMMNKTAKNLKENKFASLSVYSSGKGIQLKGLVEYHTKGPEFDFVKSDPANKGYSPKAAIVFLVLEIWDLDAAARLA